MVFRKLEAIAKEFADESKPGLGGSWTPETLKGDDRIRLSVFDGGYNAVLYSKEYNFRLTRSCSDKGGACIELEMGRLDNVLSCLESFAEKIDCLPCPMAA